MLKQKLTAGFCALLTLCCFAGCGDTVSGGDAAGIADNNAAENAPQKRSEAAENETESSAADLPEAGSPEEMETVQAVLDHFVEAVAAQDYEKVAKYDNMQLMYYLQEGEIYSDAEIAAKLQAAADASEMPADTQTSAGTAFSDLTLGTEEQLEQVQSMLANKAYWSRANKNCDPAAHFTVDRMYTVNMNSSDSSDSAAAVSLPVFVLHINGEWKLDTVLSLMMMFSSMADSLGSTAS